MEVYVIEGGVGKHVMFTALLPELATNEKVTIMSSYPDIFEGNPFVHRSLARNSQYQWDDLIMKDDTHLHFYEPYYNLDYIKGNKSLIEAWCEGLNISYENMESTALYLSIQMKRDAEMFRNNSGDFILTQFTGGQSPLFVRDQPFINDGAVKNYPHELAQEAVNLIKKEFPDITIINYGLPNETPGLENTQMMQMPYMSYAALLNEAKTFISIDSSLMHFAGALNKKGVVIWGATNPHTLGYDFHTNLTGKCKLNNLHCNKPYNRELGDYMGSGARWKCPDPTCIEVPPEKIADAVIKQIKENK
jgi:hypothetical protein